VSASKSSLAALTLGAIGVVYGDIGTSVLYSVKEVFGSGHVPFTTDNVYGILSIFFWTLTVIVSLKYVTLVLRADNHGEGGLVAMLALASQSVKDKPELRRGLLAHRRFRHLPVLWRRGHHAGHLGPVGGRGP
jgi:KUP system potassium uptake protein